MCAMNLCHVHTSDHLNSILPLAIHQVHPPKCVQATVVAMYICSATHISGAEQFIKFQKYTGAEEYTCTCTCSYLNSGPYYPYTPVALISNLRDVALLSYMYKDEQSMLCDVCIVVC